MATDSPAILAVGAGGMTECLVAVEAAVGMDSGMTGSGVGGAQEEPRGAVHPAAAEVVHFMDPGPSAELAEVAHGAAL